MGNRQSSAIPQAQEVWYCWMEVAVIDNLAAGLTPDKVVRSYPSQFPTPHVPTFPHTRDRSNMDYRACPRANGY